MNLLLVHGNGGANARFQLFRMIAQEQGASYNIHLPELPGFEGRPLPTTGAPWSWFLDALAETVANADGPWVYYGHGIGGSILLEWAKQGWTNSKGQTFKPQKVLLHGIIGASLEHRLFPKLMKPLLIRQTMKALIATPALRPIWERKLFLEPKAIPENLRRQFFEDYRRCAAFSLFFDLITPAWYQEVKSTIGQETFHFLWGDKERVIASKFLAYWQNDFPNSEFTIIEGWDHFPMLEQPQEFYKTISGMIV
ncbi:MAG: alpha/beta hydrolase [Bacteroidota bacterium]